MTTIINGSSPSITFSDGSAQTSATRPFLNRIINGNMSIDQRNAGASVSITTDAKNYVMDRFWGYDNTDGVFSLQQVVDAPAGFINSAKVTVTTADASIGADQYAGFSQLTEGFNTADLAWGTANAKSVTLSFWVKSSLTGTFGGSLRNSAADRSYPFSYTISAANTWEQKSITIAGDTSGTWLTTNGIGIRVNWSIADGSNRVGTAGAWAATNYAGSTGQTQIISTLNATWFITGVQLEVGSTATSFDYRPYGTELQLCQRYFEKSQTNAIGSTDNSIYVPSVSDGSNNAIYSWKFSVEKRALPTMTAYKPDGTSGSWEYSRSGVGSAAATVTFHQALTSCTNFYMNIGAAWTVCHMYGNLAASAEL